MAFEKRQKKIPAVGGGRVVILNISDSVNEKQKNQINSRLVKL